MRAYRKLYPERAYALIDLYTTLLGAERYASNSQIVRLNFPASFRHPLPHLEPAYTDLHVCFLLYSAILSFRTTLRWWIAKFSERFLSNWPSLQSPHDLPLSTDDQTLGGSCCGSWAKDRVMASYCPFVP